MLKARTFLHHPSLEEAWKEITATGRVQGELSWSALGRLLADKLETAGGLRAPNGVDHRGINVYASLKPLTPDEGLRGMAQSKGVDLPTKLDKRKAAWLAALDHLPAFTVKITEERIGAERCAKCPDGKYSDWMAKGLTTKLACDLLGMGISQFYDVTLLGSDDEELTPAIEAVQDILDRKVIHVGFAGLGDVVRGACWSHVLLDDVLESLTCSVGADRYDLSTVS